MTLAEIRRPAASEAFVHRSAILAAVVRPPKAHTNFLAQAL